MSEKLFQRTQYHDVTIYSSKVVFTFTHNQKEWPLYLSVAQILLRENNARFVDKDHAIGFELKNHEVVDMLATLLRYRENYQTGVHKGKKLEITHQHERPEGPFLLKFFYDLNVANCPVPQSLVMELVCLLLRHLYRCHPHIPSKDYVAVLGKVYSRETKEFCVSPSPLK